MIIRVEAKINKLIHRHKNRVNISPIMLLVLAVVSCSSLQSPELANIAIQDFHKKYNNEQYKEIYNQSDESFKQTVPEGEAIVFFTKLGEKLGKVGNTKPIKQGISVTSMGTMVTISNDTEFSRGKAQERFVFIIKDSVIKLMDYKVDSPLLLSR